MTIFLTAGHDVRPNGRGTGAFGIKDAAYPQYPHGIDEAQEAVIFRDLMTEHLRKHGLRVKNDKNDTGLAAVLTWLRQTAGEGDLCIEIHFNAGPATASGCEAIVENEHTVYEGNIARAMCRAINVATKSEGCAGIRIRNRAPGRDGVILERETARGRLAFLHAPRVAHNIILEMCFITNKRDVELYFKNRERIAKTIAEHIIYHL